MGKNLTKRNNLDWPAHNPNPRRTYWTENASREGSCQTDGTGIEKSKEKAKLNPTESAALKRLEHDLITEDGIVPATKGRHAIHCLTVIGTIEGHTLAPDSQKTTKYEHVIPQLVDIEEDPEIEGLLVILNTVGGDVEAGLALAELIAGVSKPAPHWCWGADIPSAFRWRFRPDAVLLCPRPP